MEYGHSANICGVSPETGMSVQFPQKDCKTKKFSALSQKSSKAYSITLGHYLEVTHSGCLLRREKGKASQTVSLPK